MDVVSTAAVYRFDDFLIDVQAGTIVRIDPDQGCSPIALGSRAFGILRVLVERHGEFVSKQQLMQAVWPDVVVEDSNLTVQIAALRRALDAGRSNGSCIQTRPGRGYRLLPPVTLDGNANGSFQAAAPEITSLESGKGARSPRWKPLPCVARGWLVGAGLMTAAAIWGGMHWHSGRMVAVDSQPPRLSIAIVPFENEDGTPGDEYVAQGLTDDLATDLVYLPSDLVVIRGPARMPSGRQAGIRQVGRDLHASYAVEGGIRQVAGVLRIDARLISLENGIVVWSDWLDTDPTAEPDQIVRQIADQISMRVIQLESTRGLRERPDNPTALDLVLQARNLKLLPPTPERSREALGLYERALAIDSSFVPALTGVAFHLIDRQLGEWDSFEDMERAGQLLTRARVLAPDSGAVLNATVWWLRTTGRCAEAIEAAQRALEVDPNRTRVWTGIPNELAICKTFTGHAEEDLLLQERIDRLNPLSSYRYVRFRHMGFASLMLGHDQEAIAYLERSLAINRDQIGVSVVYRWLAAAYARSGNLEAAADALGKANRLQPYDTVRSHYPDFTLSSTFAEQVRRYQDGLRLAGERDHADENADYGVPSDRILHIPLTGPTPKEAHGAITIRTPDLVGFLAAHRPIILDTMTNSWGSSLPGAIGLRFAGSGGRFTDSAQEHLRKQMQTLSDGDLQRPIVVVGFNAETFDGRNLALRLVALGYTQVYWYRGGREAWEVAGLPETKLIPTVWY